MAVQQSGAYRHQDGQILVRGRERSHAQQRWDRRAPDEWVGYPVRAAWREAEDRGWLGFGTYAREHTESGMLIICDWGFVRTSVRAEWREINDEEVEHVE